jgi:hypothetical protein
VPFSTAKTAFDHAQTAFALTGAHASTPCASCHRTADFKVAKFASCTNCHATPHSTKVSTSCTSCHTTANWRSKTFDHARTAFPLAGRHATVDCSGCHKAPATRVKPAAATCSSCHADPHKGNFRQDCKACHSESGFAGARFDHLAATGYALTDKHAPLACRACHTNISPPRTPSARLSLDYRGLAASCATCHSDPHTGELGTTCERCHSTKSFLVSAFTHAKPLPIFGGRHASVKCDGCHIPAAPPGPPPVASKKGAARRVPSFTTAPTACATCHRDPHLGQLGAACEQCHSVDAVAFKADRFVHDRTSYALAGRHRSVACAACHKPAHRDFPAGPGQAVVFRGTPALCASCHQDVHLGQLDATCETCHSPSTFRIAAYVHRRPPAGFFAGSHLRAPCAECHARRTRQFPAGPGAAIDFSVSTTCTACHTDPHRGSLGDDCARCHRPEPISPRRPS